MISPRHLSRGVNVLQQSDTLNMSTHLRNLLQRPCIWHCAHGKLSSGVPWKRLYVLMITLGSIYSNLRCTWINLNWEALSKTSVSSLLLLFLIQMNHLMFIQLIDHKNTVNLNCMHSEWSLYRHRLVLKDILTMKLSFCNFCVKLVVCNSVLKQVIITRPRETKFHNIFMHVSAGLFLWIIINGI